MKSTTRVRLSWMFICLFPIAGLANAGTLPSTGLRSNIVFLGVPPGISMQQVRRRDESLRAELNNLVRSAIAPVSHHDPGDRIDLIIVLTDEAGAPILPDLEQAVTLGASARQQNDLNFTFNSPTYPWTFNEFNQLVTYINNFYPLAKSLYGDPAFNIVVNVRKDPTIGLQGIAGYYDTLANEMVLEGAVDHVFCHEMIHAFHDD